MGFSELPFEILLKIANNLWRRELLACSLTCKGWRHPFLMVLWKDIGIHFPKEMKAFINSTKASKNISNSPSHLIHTLNIYLNFYELKSLDMDISVIFKYMDNLKCLYLGDIDYKSIYTETTKSEKVWTSLESLKIRYPRAPETQSAKNVLEFICACNKLQKLYIFEEGQSYNTEFNVDDFDNMHQNLQNLSSVNFQIYLNPDFSTTMNKISSTKPAFGVTSLYICSREYRKYINGSTYVCHNNWNPLWLCYFGHKYPNLRSITLNVADAQDNPINSDQKQAAISLFRSNPNAFRHLEVFKFATDTYFESSDFVLWDLLCALRLPLKHLKLDATRSGKVDPSYPMDVNRILQYVSEKIEKLSLTGFIYNRDHENTTLELSYYCPFLTKLCIRGKNVSLNLDNVLEKCAALKKLKFAGEKLFVNTNMISEEPKQQHGLQKLMLYDCTIKAELFHYISFRCRSLDDMTLRNLFIVESICEETGRLLVDMSYTFLKSLQIGKIKYGKPYQQIDQDGLGMTLLSQISKPRLFYERSETQENEIDSTCHIIESYDLEWLYTYVYILVNYIPVTDTTEISHEDVPFVLEYFKNFQFNKVYSPLNDHDLYYEEEPENCWKYELYKGYGEFRFGKVEYSPLILAATEDEF
ncbi:hypothetical protein J3Q64DRAFT_1698875 [Phycomyces blakesleeanus]|uniref:F-box domain-containing protein n=2 Tax=Phycomyces blakesleeanus TaxID=4837 RepID=A0A163DSB1_PHYB8|nr:hypothetical protein PHYBLDRAFT_145537 [Phycomyces blakesleeanus NRRL 1555(-)]OAD73130.1 hypothetical protein PHYBLDRAFT_145537 [Phycomyces blakesleeanus NRRL 1555(-)]|eukprot:XP_018291170.1 hypothetical protein PHYBLDRAFT_145537 [Phycomyces blakesleeanus NRRL 1555(-)]